MLSESRSWDRETSEDGRCSCGRFQVPPYVRPCRSGSPIQYTAPTVVFAVVPASSFRQLAPPSGMLTSQAPVVDLELRKVLFAVGHQSALAQSPNKAPEPTPTAVMPRAIEPELRMKRRTENHFLARATPAVGVAHL